MFYSVEKLEKWQLAYIGGIMDGEGSIYLSTSKGNTPVVAGVAVTMTSIECVDFLHRITGMGYIQMYKRPGKYKTAYKWTIASRLEIYLFLKAVHPYLLVKEKQANIMLEFVERRIKGTSINAYDFQLREDLQELNR